MEFELGQTYSGYKFLDVAKRSRCGVEYRVQNTLTQRMELLKVLPPSAQDDQEETERFMREMRVRAKLVHPNIVSFFTAMPLEGRLVMTTELVEGLPLSERLQLGPMPWREAADFVGQVLAAVDCAHQQQIVHRDISPDNIIAIPGGVVKLTNFRLAKSIHSLNLTQNGAIVGSLKYISPEQVKGTEALDHRSDLYSIGVVLYEMLTGRTPFNSLSQFELMLAHVNQQPEPASKFNSTVPAQFDAVVLKALEKLPSDRYQSAAEFNEALVRAVDELTAAEITPAAEITLTAQIAPVPEPVATSVAATAVDLPPDLQPESVAAPPMAEVVAEVALEPVAAAAVELSPAVEPELEPIFEPAMIAPAMPEVPPEHVAAATGLAATLELEPVALPAVASVALEPVAATAELPEVMKLELTAVTAAAVVVEIAPEPVVVAAELPAVLEAVPIAVTATVTLAEAAPEPVVAPPELAAAIEPEVVVVPLAAEAATEPVMLSVAELAPATEPETAVVPAIAEAATEPVMLSVAEMPPATEPETAVVLAIAEAATEPVAPADELPPIIQSEPAAEPVIAEAVSEPVAAAESAAEPAVLPVTPIAAAETGAEPAAASPSVEPVLVAAAAESKPEQPQAQPERQAEAQPERQAQAQPEQQAAPAVPSMPATALLPETAVYASLWAAAEVVSRAAQAPGGPSLDLVPVFAASRPVPGETVHAAAPVAAAIVAAPVVAVLSEPAAPIAAGVNQHTPAASVPSLSPSGAPGFLAAAKGRSEAIQWAVFGGTAAFLGVVWVAIWLITGK